MGISNDFSLWHNGYIAMDEFETYEPLQRSFCAGRRMSYVASPPQRMCGLALRTLRQLPINGLRHPAAEGTTGWYVWCGERWSTEPDFFSPVHTTHLYEHFPELKPLLGLPPGSRFLVAGDYVDVWSDPDLLEV